MIKDYKGMIKGCNEIKSENYKTKILMLGFFIKQLEELLRETKKMKG